MTKKISNVSELIGEKLDVVRGIFNDPNLSGTALNIMLEEAKRLVGEATRIQYYAKQRKYLNQLGLPPDTDLYDAKFKYVGAIHTYTCLTIDREGNLWGQPLKQNSIGRGVGMVPELLGHVSMIEHEIMRDKITITAA